MLFRVCWRSKSHDLDRHARSFRIIVILDPCRDRCALVGHTPTGRGVNLELAARVAISRQRSDVKTQLNTLDRQRANRRVALNWFQTHDDSEKLLPFAVAPGTWLPPRIAQCVSRPVAGASERRRGGQHFDLAEQAESHEAIAQAKPTLGAAAWAAAAALGADQAMSHYLNQFRESRPKIRSG